MCAQRRGWNGRPELIDRRGRIVKVLGNLGDDKLDDEKAGLVRGPLCADKPLNTGLRDIGAFNL